MGCGASSSSEPPSREGSAGKARSEERDADDQKLVSNGEVKTRHLHLKEDNNNGSLDSLNRKKKATRNQVDPLVPVSQTPGEWTANRRTSTTNEPPCPGQIHGAGFVTSVFRRSRP